MISCISYRNLREYGDVLESAFQLRYDSFIERQSYNVKTYEGKEFDQYDTPAAEYLVYHTEDGKALGVNRLTPVTVGCMLEDLWPHLVSDKVLFSSDRIWEGTRYCIKKEIDPNLRQRIINEMALAYLEFGLEKKLQKIIGMMPTYIYRSVFEKPGIEMEYLGPIEIVGRHKIRAVAIPVELEQLKNVQKKTGINQRVLTYSRTTKMERESQYVAA